MKRTTSVSTISTPQTISSRLSWRANQPWMPLDFGVVVVSGAGSTASSAMGSSAPGFGARGAQVLQPAVAGDEQDQTEKCDRHHDHEAQHQQISDRGRAGAAERLRPRRDG